MGSERRLHVLALRKEELEAVRDGRAILAPYHEGVMGPCPGCSQHRLKFVVVVVLGAPPLERFGYLMERGIDVLNAALSDREWSNLYANRNASCFDYAPDGEAPVRLILVPPEWHRQIARDRGKNPGWGARLDETYLRPSRKAVVT